MTIVIGIDPGILGGLACIDKAGVLATAMPETERGIFDWIESAAADHCFIEPAIVMPRQGAVGAFTFGQGYGFIRGILIALKIPFEEVRSAKWQPEFIPKGSPPPKPKSDATKEQFNLWYKQVEQAKRERKRALLAKAQQLFPGVKLTLKTCDALLIAEFGRRELAKRTLVG